MLPKCTFSATHLTFHFESVRNVHKSNIIFFRNVATGFFFFFKWTWVAKTIPGSSTLSSPLQEAGRETPKHRLTEMLCWQKDAWDAENNSVCVGLQEGELCYAVTFKLGLTSGLNPLLHSLLLKSSPLQGTGSCFSLILPKTDQTDHHTAANLLPLSQKHTLNPTRHIRNRAQNSNGRVSLGSLKIIMFNNIA